MAGRRPAYASLTLPGLAATLWLLVAAALLAYSAYLNGVTVPALIAAGIASLFSLFWLHRAYRNLLALGVPELPDSPISVVAWFLVPGANWLLTYPILRDLWQLSDRSDPHRLNGRRPLLVQAWYLCWAAPPLISIISLLLFERPGPGNAADRAQALVSVDVALLALASVLGAAVILGVNARQGASRKAQEAAGTDGGL